MTLMAVVFFPPLTSRFNLWFGKIGVRSSKFGRRSTTLVG